MAKEPRAWLSSSWGT